MEKSFFFRDCYGSAEVAGMIQIIYSDIAPGADENASYSGQIQPYASLDNLSAGASSLLVATGESGRWKLNGSVDIYGYTSADYGYVSLEQSDDSGIYASDVGLEIVLSENYTSSGLTILFDMLEDLQYVVNISWYNDSTLLQTVQYTGSADFVIEHVVTLYNKIKIEFVSSSKPRRFARIQKVIFGIERLFTPSDFTAANLIQEVNPISEELAIDTSTFTLRPQTQMRYMFQSRQPFKIYRDGELAAAHYLRSADTTAYSNYAVSCQSSIGILAEQPFPAKMYINQTAKQIAVDILGDTFPWSMQTSLQSIVLSGYIPEGNKRSALHQLLFAIGAVCTTADSDVIRIFTLPQTAKQIPAGNIYTGASIKANPVVTSVKLDYHTYSTSASEGADSIEIDGVTYYDIMGYVLKNNPNVVSGTPDNPVEITTATLVTQTRANALIDSLYAYYIDNTEVAQKIIITNEAPGDRVQTIDILDTDFTGIITKRETSITNLFASTLTIRGKNV